MNREEIHHLTRVVAAICPAQAFEQNTPAVWAALLDGITYADAWNAAVELGRTAKFIAPADIIDVVRRVRRERLNAPGVEEWIGAHAPETPEERRDLLRRIADGEHVPQAPTTGPGITPDWAGMLTGRRSAGRGAVPEWFWAEVEAARADKHDERMAQYARNREAPREARERARSA